MARQSPSSRPAGSRPAASRNAPRKAAPAAAPAAPAAEPVEPVEEEVDAVEAIDDEVDTVEDVDAADDAENDEDAEDADADLDEDDVDEEDGAGERSALADAMWNDVRVEPVEIALPKGVGYTLRAYRLNTELTPTEVDEEEDDFAILHRRPAEDEDDDRVVILENAELFEDEPEPAVVEASSKTDKKKPARKDAADSDDSDDSDLDEAAELDEDSDKSDEDDADDVDDEADAEDEDEEEEEEEEAEPEEVPAFLSHRGKLLLFRSAEGLVEFVQTDAEHDLTQLDTWESLKKRITVAAVVPSDENRYELDLVVENLRGGQDAWDSELLLGAGEAARDLAYALRLEAVRTALSPGSPLDDLDEGLRAAASGGVGGFFAKRRLKKIGAQQAALGWRTIIGKISAAVDWRD
ncbi:DNA primase [Dactylosporangium sp. McL0621]|uniref:DNA primase n=1 Tax=Dactylosporangium sp. McL0621 TaxID=3415678 RepID=UPI003CEACFA5